MVFLSSRYLKPQSFIIIILLFNSGLFCQSSQEYTFKRFFNEGGDLIKSASHRPASDWIRLSLVAGGTVALMQFDEDVRKEMLAYRSPAKNVFAEIGRYWGEPYTSAGVAAILLIHGFAADNNDTKEIGFETAQAYFYSMSVTSILKLSLGRARPRTGMDAFTYHPFNLRGDDHLSFPSGHATGAFSLSAVLASHIKSDVLKGAVFIPAFLTMYSRMYQNHHWLSDVFAGAFIGYWMGTYFTNLHEKQKELEPNLPPSQIIDFQIMF
jgi:undecaprenyl-diphosphatase